MFQFSDLTIEAAVANQGEAMEAETISKNGASSKSQMSRGNFLSYLVIASFALMTSFMFIGCGSRGGSSSDGSGGNDKPLSGTYQLKDDAYGVEVSFTFSGNKWKFDFKAEGETFQAEGLFELVEEYKENGFSRGVITLKDREGEKEGNYSLEGNNLTIDRHIVRGFTLPHDVVFTKK